MGRLWLVMTVCIAASIMGVIYAVCCGDASDGGGAVAVAITFGMLFLDRGTAKDLIEMELPTGPQASQVPASDTELKDYLASLATEEIKDRNTLAAMLDWQDKQKLPLAISSVVGTFFWGFGDVVAQCLGAA